MIDAFNCLPSGPPKTLAHRRLMTGRASDVKMSPGFAAARAFSTSFASARWFLSICSGVASFGSFGSDRSSLTCRATYSFTRAFMVASAWASAGVSGPTTRTVGGADAGDADVAGGAEGLSPLPHALSDRTAAATRLMRTPLVVDMAAPSFIVPVVAGLVTEPQRHAEVLLAQHPDRFRDPSPTPEFPTSGSQAVRSIHQPVSAGYAMLHRPHWQPMRPVQHSIAGANR